MLAQIAFLDDDAEIRVNFGMFAGREATQAEIDDLAHDLLVEARRVTIVAEHRTVADATWRRRCTRSGSSWTTRTRSGRS